MAIWCVGWLQNDGVDYGPPICGLHTFCNEFRGTDRMRNYSVSENSGILE